MSTFKSAMHCNKIIVKHDKSFKFLFYLTPYYGPLKS